MHGNTLFSKISITFLDKSQGNYITKEGGPDPLFPLLEDTPLLPSMRYNLFSSKTIVQSHLYVLIPNMIVMLTCMQSIVQTGKTK